MLRSQDLRNPRFRTVLRGVSRWEVREVLGAVADDLEAAIAEVERLRAELASLGVRLSEIHTRDREATRLLSQAEADARVIGEMAEREAAEVIARAEARAQAMLQEVEAERQLLAARIEQCEERRRRIATVLQDEVNDLRAFLEAEPVPVAPPADPAPVAAVQAADIEPELPVEQLDEDSAWSAADVQRALAAVTGARVETGERFEDAEDRADDPFGAWPSSNETTSSKTPVAARFGRFVSRKWLAAAGAAAAV
ncbi:MAG TPA: DivIVA domain-containing protein, partial [Vicinamibacterales bacterium]|nr:DivIVA domain-containing protein [Vicinamibacterales bacterium]